jgi:hypothetical protein
VQSSPLGAPRVGIDPSAANGAAISQGLQQLNAGITQATGELERVYRHEKQRAQAVAVTDAETAFSRAITTELQGDSTVETSAPGALRRTGFLQLRGTAAAESSAKAVESLRQAQKKVAEGLTDAEVRQLFLQRSAGQLESAVGRVEGHVGAEIQAAAEVSLKARVHEAIEAVANAAPAEDFDTAQKEAWSLWGNIQALALSPEAAEAQLADVKARMAGLRLQKRLKVKDVKGAEEVYAEVKDVLGADAVKFEEDLASLRTNVNAESLAATLSAAHLRKDGLLDEKAAMAALREAAGADVKLLDEATLRLRHRATEAKRDWDMRVDDLSRRAFAEFNKKGWGGMDSKLRDELNEANPNLWDRLRDDAEQRYRRSQESKSDAQRAQSEANRLAMQEYMKLPQEERAALNVGVFVAGMGGVDKLGLGAIEVQQRRDKDAVQKGQSVREGDFVRNVSAEASGVITDKTQLSLLQAEARIAHDRFVQDFKRPPSVDEQSRLTQVLLQKVVKERWWILPDGEQFEFQRRAAERKEAMKKQQPQATPAAAPRPAAASPAATPQAGRPPLSVRARQLKAEGKSRAEAARILTSEGYDLSELGK